MQRRMAVGFVGLEKAYDIVPRKMVKATVRWMGVPEAEARMVEAMYERTKGRVVVGSGLSEEFPVNIGLRQGIALDPLLFIMVMEIISRKISMKDILRKMMYAFSGKSAMSDTSGSKCIEKGRGRVMLDRKISKKLKGKVLRTCVTPACLYDLETVTLTEQQQKLQVCENNWVR